MLWIYFAWGLSLGILVGITFQKYVSTCLDALLEEFIYHKSVKCTHYKLEADALVADFELAYGTEEGSAHAIGFEFTPPQEEEYDDYEIEDKKFGFQSPKIN